MRGSAAPLPELPLWFGASTRPRAALRAGTRLAARTRGAPARPSARPDRSSVR